MNYRPFGKTGIKVSALGFGCMRLPYLNEDPAQINKEEAIRMLRHAMDSGVNYLDTAWGYHQEQSEPLVGLALQDGYREKTYLATKMPSWLIKTYDDLDKHFEIQLERLKTDHIDFYLLHTLNEHHWSNYKKLDVAKWIEKRKAEGSIRNIGFSFHDRYPVFEMILNDYTAWDFCQIQLNYMDVLYQAGLRGLREASSRGMGVVIMEPLRGGKLAANPQPPAVQAVLDSSNKGWKPVEWALQWLWDQAEVSLVLSGMSTMEQVQENLAIASRSGVGSLTDAERALMVEVEEAYRGLMPIPCTHCDYCQPCPADVAIPDIFEIYNTGKAYGMMERAVFAYNNHINDKYKANNCVECGQCESLCPQHIEIIDWLKTTHAELYKEKS